MTNENMEQPQREENNKDLSQWNAGDQAQQNAQQSPADSQAAAQPMSSAHTAPMPATPQMPQVSFSASPAPQPMQPTQPSQPSAAQQAQQYGYANNARSASADGARTQYIPQQPGYFAQPPQPTRPMPPVPSAPAHYAQNAAYQSAPAPAINNPNAASRPAMPPQQQAQPLFAAQAPLQSQSSSAQNSAQASTQTNALSGSQQYAQPGAQSGSQPSANAYAQPGNTQPGAPAYTAPDTSAAAMNAAQNKAKNAFADPANAYGTQASVTASGVAANADTVGNLIKKNRAVTLWTSLGAAAVAALLVAGLGYAGIRTGVVTVPSDTSLSSIDSSTGAAGTASSSASNVNWSAVAKKVSNSVVSIQGTVSNGSVIGSGAILDKNGNIITNNHVVSGAQNIQVTLADGSIYKAKIVGTDATTDLAVIKMENPPSNLTAVSFANSDDLAVGQSVMAIGSPLGYANTATTGIVSALNRPVSVTSEDRSGNVVVTNAVQIDASINSGNSGGPTFDANGKLIGINSSIATTGSSSSSEGSAGSIGIGFAIPSNLASWVSSALMKDGKVTHVSLGVTVKSDTATADGVTRSGSQVQSVVSGSAAEAAGVKEGDLIVGYNKHSVSSNSALLGYVRATQKGEKITLTIIRNGKTIDLTATMDKEENTTTSNSGNSNNSQDPNGSDNGDGNNQERNRNNSGSNDDDSNDMTNPFEEFFGRN
ncbi:trypsin-like peptidase domain-containing protein [Alloscardovia omnicolens]|uniref:trypsin-like peptidase domain-containing protein n=1 Tax=Alloscardovia omnicolens TaxID=419015 RepID=UPI003A6CB31E